MMQSLRGLLFVRSTRSRAVRTAVTIASLTSLGFVAACSSDSTTGPNFDRNENLVVNATNGVVTAAQNTLINVTGLLRDKPFPLPVSRSQTITQKDGGQIDVPGSGFTLIIPKGAIPATSMTITVTALPGSAVAYDFQPHGTIFLKALTFSQTLGGTSWAHLNFKGTLTGGYFKNTDQVNTTTGQAILDETFTATVADSKVLFNIFHFSGYMVSTGRSEMSTDQF